MNKFYTVDKAIDGDFQAATHDGVESLTDEFKTDLLKKVEIDKQPWIDFFGTDTFYQFEPVVARPIVQRYFLNGEVYRFKKDRQELIDAQWQIDNLPWTVTHPDNDTISSTDEIRGFFRDPWWDDAVDGQRAKLFVPDNDEAALDYIRENRGISIGFSPEFEWVDNEEYDAIKRNLLYDHIASVAHGRCSVEDGCGLDVVDDGGEIAHRMKPVSKFEADDGCGPAESCSAGPCSCGEHTDSGVPITDEGVHYGIKPSENPDGDWNFRLETPEDIRDAFNQREDDYTIDSALLVKRIKTRSDQLDCSPEYKPWTSDTTMTDNPFDDLDPSKVRIDVLADSHDGVASLVDERDELEERVDALTDKKDELEERVNALKEKKEQLADSLKEYQASEKEQVVDEIMDLTDHWDREDLMDVDDLEKLTDRREFAAEALADDTTVGDGEDVTDSGEETEEGVEDLVDENGLIDLS